MVTASYKVGKNKGRPRIWIDGKKLADAGFKGGTTYFSQVTYYLIRCTLADPPHDVTTVRTTQRKVTGRPDGKPIIDMLGQDVETAFPGATRVKVTFEPGVLTIKREA